MRLVKPRTGFGGCRIEQYTLIRAENGVIRWKDYALVYT